MKLRSILGALLVPLLLLNAAPRVRAADVTSLPAQVDALLVAVSNLTLRVAALESAKATQASQIAELQSKVTVLLGNGPTPQTAAINALQTGLAQEIAARLAGDMSTTQDAHAYADSKIAAAFAQEAAARAAGDNAVGQASHQYTDAQIAAAVGQEASARQAGDAATSQDAHQYVDGKLAAALAQEATARQAGDSAAIQDAHQYADSKTGSLLSQAQAYTDGQLAPVIDKLVHFSRSGNNVYITGANLHVRNGTGGTYQSPNGLGNLIVGYNELRGGGATDTRTGSHNLVLGFGINYSASGSILTGAHNSSSNHFASVLGGSGNTASGLYSVVVGGYNNTASGNWSTIGGGQGKTASGQLQDIP